MTTETVRHIILVSSVKSGCFMLFNTIFYLDILEQRRELLVPGVGDLPDCHAQVLTLVFMEGGG